MKTDKLARDLFDVKAKYNGWLNELTLSEISLIFEMFDEYAEEYHKAKMSENTEKLKELNLRRSEVNDLYGSFLDEPDIEPDYINEMKTDKLAEKILKKHDILMRDWNYDIYVEAMQEYHKAKMAEMEAYNRDIIEPPLICPRCGKRMH